MKYQDHEFDQEAVEEMAQAIDSTVEDMDDGPGGDLIREMTTLCNKHGIDADDRIDFAVAGLRHYFRIKETQAVSDFRESLEKLYRFFG